MPMPEEAQGEKAPGEEHRWGRWLASGLGAVLLLSAGMGWWTAPRADPVVVLPLSGQAAQAPADVGLRERATDVLPGGVLPERAATDSTTPGQSARREGRALSPEEREARRFNRYDRDRDGMVSREEFLADRRKAFNRLDANGDGRLDFGEFAAATADRFDKADRNGDRRLSGDEFSDTAVQLSPTRRGKS